MGPGGSQALITLWKMEVTILPHATFMAALLHGNSRHLKAPWQVNVRGCRHASWYGAMAPVHDKCLCWQTGPQAGFLKQEQATAQEFC